MIYVNIDLNGSSYCQPVDKLGDLLDDIREAVSEERLDEVWTVTLLEMTEEEYSGLSEFTGH